MGQAKLRKSEIAALKAADGMPSAQVLDEVAEVIRQFVATADVRTGGKCFEIADLAAEELSRRGFRCSKVSGNAAFALGSHMNDTLIWDTRARKDTIGGDVEAHCWLQTKTHIIDFSPLGFRQLLDFMCAKDGYVVERDWPTAYNVIPLGGAGSDAKFIAGRHQYGDFYYQAKVRFV